MNVNLRLPSKTFLCGEYAVLAGGPALVLNTKPQFELRAYMRRDHQQLDVEVHGFSDGSPAKRWIEQREPLLRGWRLEFLDPWQGRGGLGASSAQFVAVHALTTLLQRGWSTSVAQLSPWDMWNDYQVLTGYSGSGVDVLAQFTGQVARVDLERKQLQALTWAHAELGFLILKTGEKLATHNHLREAGGLKERAAELVSEAQAAVSAYGKSGFVSRLSEFAQGLEARELSADTTLPILRRLRAQPWVRVTKGCGAMGMDTVLVVFDVGARSLALNMANQLLLECVGSDLDLCAGLEVHIASH